MHVYNRFREVKTIVTEAVASTTASAASTITSTGKMAATIICTTGYIWVNPLATATTANGIKLIEGQALDLIIPNTVSLISDTTTASYQAIFWKD